MKRSRLRVLAAVATLLALSVGVAPVAAAADAEDWAKAYCKASLKLSDVLGESSDNSRALVDAIQSGGNVEAVIDDYDAQLAKAAKFAKKTAAALKKVGAPDVKGGTKLNKAAIKAYKTAAKELGNARSALGDIDPADPTGSADPLLTLGGALGDAGSAMSGFAFDTLSPAVDKSKELATAIGSSC